MKRPHAAACSAATVRGARKDRQRVARILLEQRVAAFVGRVAELEAEVAALQGMRRALEAKLDARAEHDAAGKASPTEMMPAVGGMQEDTISGEVATRLAPAAPILWADAAAERAELVGSTPKPIDVVRRNVAMHCMKVDAGRIATMSLTALNSAQRKGGGRNRAKARSLKHRRRAMTRSAAEAVSLDWAVQGRQLGVVSLLARRWRLTSRLAWMRTECSLPAMLAFRTVPGLWLRAGWNAQFRPRAPWMMKVSGHGYWSG